MLNLQLVLPARCLGMSYPCRDVRCEKHFFAEKLIWLVSRAEIFGHTVRGVLVTVVFRELGQIQIFIYLLKYT